ncbi:MAG TPA: hypothetical protein VED20_06620 [Streptosporangiaceae bacterium]|nr:hypothetical protein [Streptosporangiaceae bacterium]
MQPTFQNEIMKARTADLHARADQARRARAATQGRRTLRQHGTPRVLPGLRSWPVLRRLAI